MPTGSHQTTASPIGQLPAHDYGAETLRNYRYQSAYAIVILAAAAAKKNDYQAIWCEQEDDLLGQANDHVFDSYQVKTQKPELGAWEITDDAFVSSIKVFLGLNTTYHDKFRRFHFVSNTDCLSTDAKKKKHLCPKRLAAATTACFGHGDLNGSDATGFKTLRDKTGATADGLFRVLKKLVFLKGPSRDSFIAELAQNHLSQLDWCQLPQPRLEFLVKSLLGMVDNASSLSAQDPARHYVKTRELAGPRFRYQPSLTTSPLAQTSKGLKRFNKKLSRGGLKHYADTLRNQMLSASAQFYDLVTRSPEEKAKLSHLENVVRAECDEAHLRASQGKKPFGQPMLIDVQDRLRQIAEKEPGKVYKYPYEALMGMVGLLTDKCPVWWSDKFTLEDEK
jgi:hypothetical protein